MRAQRSEIVVAPALRPVVHDDLIHPVEDIELERALRPVRDEQATRVEPSGSHDWLGLRESRRLDDDVGSDHRLLDRVRDAHRLSERRLEAHAEGVARVGPSARDADLIETEQPVEHLHVRERGAARTDVREYLGTGACELPRTECRERARPPVR